MDLSHRTITQMERYSALDLSGIDRDLALKLFYQMLRLRRTEEALHDEYHPAEEMRCPIHFCIGQEAIPAALSVLVEPDDFMFQPSPLARLLFRQGRADARVVRGDLRASDGANGGKAGSQDISHSESHFYSGAILAGAVSIAVGAAFGFKHRKTQQISISGFGEGATDEGAFWEAMNYSGNKKLPILFVIENNRYATFSDQLKRQASDNITERVRPFGVRATQIFGNDVALAWRTLREEIERLRAGDGPALVEAYTYRWNSHVGPEDDSANAYRMKEEMQFWKNNCPLVLMEEKLRATGFLDDARKTAMEAEVAAEIADNFKFAKESPFPKETDWHHMNYDDKTPLADKLLGTAVSGDFDHYQADAKLGPY